MADTFDISIFHLGFYLLFYKVPICASLALVRCHFLWSFFSRLGRAGSYRSYPALL